MFQRAARRRRKDFVERTIAGLLGAVESALSAETLAKAPGLLQGLDPRVKVVGLMALLIAAVVAQEILVIAAIFACAVALAVLSKVPLRVLAMREWIGVGVFTGFIALPAIFTTPGSVIYRLPLLDWPITTQGLRSALYLVARAETAATLALLLILCTPWTHVLKALESCMCRWCWW